MGLNRFFEVSIGQMPCDISNQLDELEKAGTPYTIYLIKNVTFRAAKSRPGHIDPYVIKYMTFRAPKSCPGYIDQYEVFLCSIVYNKLNFPSHVHVLIDKNKYENIHFISACSI